VSQRTIFKAIECIIMNNNYLKIMSSWQV